MCISKIVSTDLNECSFLRSIEARSEIVDGTSMIDNEEQVGSKEHARGDQEGRRFEGLRCGFFGLAPSCLQEEKIHF